MIQMVQLHGGYYDGKYYAVSRENAPQAIQMFVPPEPILVTSEEEAKKFFIAKREIYKRATASWNYYFTEIE